MTINKKMFAFTYEGKVAQAAKYLGKHIDKTPKWGIILGSGLGGLVNSIENQQTIPYKKIPNYPVSSIKGHDNQMVFGDLEGVPVVALQGRTHYFEVSREKNGIDKVVFPVHVLADMGIENLLITNAAGGLGDYVQPGTVMIITDHINGIPEPLGNNRKFQTITGKDTEVFTSMHENYHPILSDILYASMPSDIARKGVYRSVPTKAYQTAAEAKEFAINADAVGKSTTPENIVARNRGMRVVGLSAITNMSGVDTSHQEVTDEAGKLEGQIIGGLQEFFKKYEK